MRVTGRMFRRDRSNRSTDSCRDSLNSPPVPSLSLADEHFDRLQEMERVHNERLETLERTQKATLEVLAELGNAVNSLKEAVNENTSSHAKFNEARDIVPAPQAMTETEEQQRGEDGEFDRKQVRLDGLEVYAVVSAVTAGTLVAVFDGYQPGDIIDMFHNARYLEVAMSLAFLVTGSIGIVCGLHCIFVFSLITMYGRTALGMERDDALEIFFAGTGMQRFRGFQSFVRSLYALMGELIVVITSKVSSRPSVHVTALCATMTLMYYVYRDTQVIMDKAGVIFAPLPVLPPAQPKRVSVPASDGENEEEETEVGTSPTTVRNARPSRPSIKRGVSSFNVSAISATALLEDCDSNAGVDTPRLHEEKAAIQAKPQFSRGRSSFNLSADALMEESNETEPQEPTSVLRQRPGLGRMTSSLSLSAGTQIQQNKQIVAKRGGRPGLEKRPSSLSVAAVDLLTEDD